MLGIGQIPSQGRERIWSRYASGKLCLALMLGLIESAGLSCAQDSAVDQSQVKPSSNIQTTDYLVPHISTVPANAGKRAELFVREKVASGRRGNARVVLMIVGSTISAVPDFNLQFENYSWMEYLAPPSLTSSPWISRVTA